MSPSTIQSEDQVRSILANACDGRELLILVTPYVRFESNFIHLEKDALHVRVTMGAEEAMFALRSPDLHLRFPYSTRFLEGHTKLLGFGLVEGRRTIRLAVPKVLNDDEQRGAYRVERVGRVYVTLSNERYDIRTASLVNISTTGAKVTALQDVSDSLFKPGSEITVSIPLTDEIKIDARAIIRWGQGRGLGIEFDPTLPESILTPFSRWIFKKREEDRDAVGRAAAPQKDKTSGVATGGIALVSASAELLEMLLGAWVDLPPLHRVAPIGQALKDALASNPPLLIFHLPSAGLDDRRRLKMLVEQVGGKVPFVILGTQVDNPLLFELGTDLKAASVFGLQGKPSAFFYRFLQGILRKHSEGGEGVLASKES